MGTHIDIKHAEEHNLKGVSAKIPRDSLVVVTGVSGSGKSSLAFDTIFQEGQRKYIESLSSYARQFIGQMKAPEVEHISGISPTISIDQKTVNRNPRSTVGTTTGIYDFFRLLFARLGTPHCPGCGDVIQAQTVDQIADSLLFRHKGKRAMLMAPIVWDRKGEYRKEQEDLREKGFVRARIDGKVHRLEEIVPLKRYEKHTIEAVIDRLRLESKNLPRIREAMETALSMTDNQVSILVLEEGNQGEENEEKPKETHLLQSTSLACASCGISLPEMEPRLFSFNNPQGACPECEGLGVKKEFDVSKVIPDESLSVEEGAIQSLTDKGNVMFSHYGIQELRILAEHYGFDLNTPWKKLTKKQQKTLLYGSDKSIRFSLKREGKFKSSTLQEDRKIRGVMDVMQRVWDQWHIPLMEKYMDIRECSGCNGNRLRPESLAVLFRDKNIVDFNAMSIVDACDFFHNLELDSLEEQIGREILKEIRARLGFLVDVGLGYLSLDRSSATLSGGEGQRIRLASQVGAGLQGVLYVLDEPSIGLHARDNAKLLQTLFYLRNLGNSLVVVEHDEDTMRLSDYLLDIGPGAGVEGGTITAQGTFEQVVKNPKSLTGQYLLGKKTIEVPTERRPLTGKDITVLGAQANNLKSVDVSFPLGNLVCITGVSGSGKSTLVNGILKKAVAQKLYNNSEEPGQHKKVEGIQHVDRLVEIDQSPIGRTPRSNPATYTGVFDHIRDLYAGLPESKVRGYKKGRFSFNVAGGRCEACKGAGEVEVEMQLLANVSVPCEECGGKRFNDATLEVHYKGLTIFDVLELSISEAFTFFEKHPKIRRGLEMLNHIGLGYIKLGQPSTTLSGGEAQRVKLATELQKPGTGKTLYILDEPTTGLHFEDIRKLLSSLQSLVDKENSVLVIEHNLDVVKVADYVIDMGPEGGSGGGTVVAVGTPEDIVKVKTSHTGKALKPILKAAASKKVDTSALNVSGLAAARKKTHKGNGSRDIVVKGGCKHNLKNVDVSIPQHKLTVITGVSGSGKSSLAFGTLFAEGQRRFIESLSTYARRFLGRLDKGDVDSIEGLAPAIAIDQKTASRSSKSTVATITEIYDYFRLLYARLGKLHCPTCGEAMEPYSVSGMVREVLKEYKEKNIKVLAPLYIENVEHDFFLDTPDHLLRVLSQLEEQGFRKFWIDGALHRSDDIKKTKAADLKNFQSIYLYIDGCTVKTSSKGRLMEAFEMALEKGHGVLEILIGKENKNKFYSTLEFCPNGHFFLKEKIEPRNFSFNSHWGACTECQGLGVVRQIDPNRLIEDPNRPLRTTGVYGRVRKEVARTNGYYNILLEALFRKWGYTADVCFNQLSKRHQREFLYGSSEQIRFERIKYSRISEYQDNWKGLIPLANKWYERGSSRIWIEEREEMVAEGPCPSCNGSRLKAPYCDVTVRDITIGELGSKTVDQALDIFSKWKWSATEKQIGEPIFREIKGRLAFLASVGLGYLGLDRVGNTLSGGEAQRIRLASQIGSGLEGVLYVLDEPTVGLHQRDTEQLVHTLKMLRDLGNTVVVVEHDPEMIEQADWIVDMGPHAGELGGEVVAKGTPAQIKKKAKSLTGQYLSGKKQMETFLDVPSDSKKEKKECVSVQGAQMHSLKNLSLEVPLNRLVTFCGVSGSGKSSLVMDVLVGGIQALQEGHGVPKHLCKSLKAPLNTKGQSKRGIGEGIDQLIVVDQTPLGTTPRSNPITYGKAFDKIRDIYATMPKAKMKGFTKSRFSINTGNGRCEACEGMGFTKMEMHFLSDVWVTCESCKGKRYNADTLDVLYKGKNISDVLDMTVEEARTFFEAHKTVRAYLDTLYDVGLGYIRLGQSSTTLSGGEAQRVKLAAELSRGTRKRNLYVFDEPSTGLHLSDIHQLQRVLRRLVDKGHSVWVIEHQMHLIAGSDWVVELGPEGGDAGGQLLFEGTPTELRDLPAKKQTPTGKSLRGV